MMKKSNTEETWHCIRISHNKVTGRTAYYLDGKRTSRRAIILCGFLNEKFPSRTRNEIDFFKKQVDAVLVFNLFPEQKIAFADVPKHFLGKKKDG